MLNRKMPESFMFLMVCYRNELTKALSDANIGVPLAQVKALKVAQMVENCTPLYIAKACHTDKSQMARILKVLIDKEMISKAPNPNDKRSQIIQINEAGHTLLATLKTIETRILSEMTSGISDEEIETFNLVAGKLANNIYNG